MQNQIKFILSIICCLYLHITNAQTTAIPDTNFEQALVNQGIDSDGLVNGQILNADVNTITLLNVSNSNISDLTGISAFTSLRSLRCQDNQLTALDVTNNTALDFLYCSNNQISTLNLNFNTALASLLCANNQLSSLNFSNNSALDFVSCSNNQLTGITFNNNNVLEYLACSDNQLTSLNLSTKTNLEFIYANNNQLTTLDIASTAPLKTIECDDNQLTTLNLSSTNTSTLERLFCRANQLASLNLSNSTLLQELRCNNNQLTSLNIAATNTLTYVGCENNQLASLNLANNTALTHIRCQNNQLTALNVSNNTALEFLECENNLITSLDLTASTALIRLTCQYNQLTNLTIPSNNTLLEVNCEHNLLTTLNLANNTAVEMINCGSNLLSNININNTIALNLLECDSNQLTSLNTSSSSALSTLYCFHNQLTRLDISNNTLLEDLNGSGNQINSLNTTNNNQLRVLVLFDNQLTTLNVANNTLLEHIQCGSNRLSHLNISNHLFLRSLILDNNQLSTLSVSNIPQLIYLTCFQNQLTSLLIDNCPSLQYLNSGDNQLQYLNLKNLPNLGQGVSGLDSVHLSNNLPNLIICVDDANLAATSVVWVEDATATYTEICPNTTLVGNVKADDNNNCLLDNMEPIVENAIISISDGTNTLYRKSNTIGNYTAELDTGTYTLNILPPNPYFSACDTSQTITIDSINDRDTADWALQTTHSCPFMVANLSAPFLRATGGGSNYVVNYCNQGTAPTYDAYIEVTIDSNLTVLGTSLPIVSQSANTYTFDLDTINIGECGQFTIGVIADSTLTLGHVLCSEVHIYPDSLCNNTWNGPIIQTSGSCQGGNVIFTLDNIGGNMNTPLSYIVIEDNIIMRDTTFILNGNSSQNIVIPTQAGSTYRIEAQQAPNFPAVLGPHIAQFNIVSCQSGGVPNLGLPLNYYNGNTAPWIDIDCQELRAAYDPNDKTPQPIGYGSQHYISNPTPIRYKVRFQNTGNDTAFNVVILDTISSHLDIATLQMQAASHTYNWSLTTGNALRVDFPSIKLVDSTTNEPLSHGFFTYTISPKPNLPLETRIENTAAIYFDYNPPIFTNTTFHTIGENFMPRNIVSVHKVTTDAIAIHAYPNPFDEMTTVAVEGKNYQKLELVLTDITGRVLQYQQVQHTNQIQVQRENLLSGIYIYQLKGDGELIGTGKLMLK